jgi:hypothetical protein
MRGPSDFAARVNRGRLLLGVDLFRQVRFHSDKHLTRESAVLIEDAEDVAHHVSEGAREAHDVPISSGCIRSRGSSTMNSYG